MDQSRITKTLGVRAKSALAPIFVALALAGCGPQFVRIDSAQSNVTMGAGYKAQLPVGWVQLKLPSAPEQIALTKDGFAVQRVAIQCVPHADAFKALKKSSDANMLPNDLAEMMVANMRAVPGAPPIEVKSIVPTTVGGARAYKATLEQKTGRGLVLRTIASGFTDNASFCSASYTAPALHFFERDAAAFDAIVASIKK